MYPAYPEALNLKLNNWHASSLSGFGLRGEQSRLLQAQATKKAGRWMQTLSCRYFVLSSDMTGKHRNFALSHAVDS